jgi:hypothetical protein
MSLMLGSLSKLEVINNLFSSYKYLVCRPNNIPNNDGYADVANFIGWYIENILDADAFNDPDIYTWTLCEDLEYSGKRKYSGMTCDININLLWEDDIIIFSTNPSFTSPDPGNYWGGVFLGYDNFVNFNTIENLGSRPLIDYINDYRFSYMYYTVYRFNTNPTIAQPEFGLHGPQVTGFLPNSPLSSPHN